MSIPDSEERAISDERADRVDGDHVISLDEASRQLEQAVHDAQVAYDCIALGNLDRAHTNAITARAAVDAAEGMLRAAVGGADVAFHPGPAGVTDAEPDTAFEAFGPGDDETFDAGDDEAASTR